AAVRDAETREALRQAERVAQTNPAVRQAGNKVFILKDGVWIDTTYAEGVKVTKVEFASEDYFRLLAAYPEWGAYFALGLRVIVVLEGQAFEVTLEEQPPLEFPQPAEEPLSPESSDSLFQLLRDLWEWVWGYFAHVNGDGYGKSRGASQPSAFVLSLFLR
ncbi:MAG: hypothetical protein HYZ68_00600, partial [Chloroflexi bacterium]|nr:hypothetical protein [Chloroflexota bacterium]